MDGLRIERVWNRLDPARGTSLAEEVFPAVLLPGREVPIYRSGGK